MVYSSKLLYLKDLAPRIIGQLLRKNLELKQLLLKETSFLNYDATIAHRMWYVRNDIYEQVKCPVCGKPTKVRENKIQCCCLQCTRNKINPETGLTKAQEISINILKANAKINPETGLTKAQEGSLKAAKTMKQIDPETGLSIYQKSAKKISEHLNKIDEKTGLSNSKKHAIKQKITKSKINTETGLTKAQEISNKAAKTMRQIDPETGLSTYQKSLNKQINTKLKINTETGLTVFEETAIKSANTMKKVNPITGKSIYTIAGEKSTKEKRKKFYYRLQQIFKSNYKNYKLLTSLDTYVNRSNNFIKYEHECGEIRESCWPYIRCLKCYPYNRSIAENEILEFCQSLSSNVQSNSRQIIKPQELDIHIPDHNLAIEYNGLFWHSSYSLESEDKDYHLIKTNLCKEKGIQLFHIFENEWEDPNKQEIWKSIIKNKLGKSSKIFARKCKIKEIASKETKEFLENNHLQGSCLSSINVGLYYEDELVSLMTFGKSRFNKKVDWELLRFCNKINYSVVGAASRLFKNFLKEHTGSIVSYADMRYSDGRLYRNLGFKFRHESNPNYFYWKDELILESRIGYQKHKLNDKLEEFDENLTETENMYNNGYRKIYDCGNQVWIFKN